MRDQGRGSGLRARSLSSAHVVGTGCRGTRERRAVMLPQRSSASKLYRFTRRGNAPPDRPCLCRRVLRGQSAQAWRRSRSTTPMKAGGRARSALFVDARSQRRSLPGRVHEARPTTDAQSGGASTLPSIPHQCVSGDRVIGAWERHPQSAPLPAKTRLSYRTEDIDLPLAKVASSASSSTGFTR